MRDLIEALTIFAKYTDARYPTTCEHGILYLNVVHRAQMTPEDFLRVQQLGFVWDEDIPAFASTRFGSN